MPASKLKEFLDSNKVKYKTINHSPAYTAQEVAATAHVPGKDFAKTVIVKIDGNLAMVVEPANQKVNFESVKNISDSKDVELASEAEFQDRFPGCELGAMPPFGNLYDMDVYISDVLSNQNEISFNAGSHSELIKMSYSDFEKLVNPKVISGE